MNKLRRSILSPPKYPVNPSNF